MQKSKLGISVGLLGAIMCFAAFFNGYLAAIIMLGYILLFETNEWLRKTSVKVVVVMIAFSVINTVIGFIPDAIGIIDSLFGIIGKSFSIGFVSALVRFVTDVLDVIKSVVFLMLGLKALNQGTISLGPVDRIVENHFFGKKEDN